jgi:hypothetical protein
MAALTNPLEIALSSLIEQFKKREVMACDCAFGLAWCLDAPDASEAVLRVEYLLGCCMLDSGKFDGPETGHRHLGTSKLRSAIMSRRPHLTWSVVEIADHDWYYTERLAALLRLLRNTETREVGIFGRPPSPVQLRSISIYWHSGDRASVVP